jgi:hypothetical protein
MEPLPLVSHVGPGPIGDLGVVFRTQRIVDIRHAVTPFGECRAGSVSRRPQCRWSVPHDPFEQLVVRALELWPVPLPLLERHRPPLRQRSFGCVSELLWRQWRKPGRFRMRSHFSQKPPAWPASAGADLSNRSRVGKELSHRGISWRLAESAVVADQVLGYVLELVGDDMHQRLEAPVEGPWTELDLAQSGGVAEAGRHGVELRQAGLEMHLGEALRREAVGTDDFSDSLHPDSVLLAAGGSLECLEERFDVGTNGISDGLSGYGALHPLRLRLPRDADRGGTGDCNRCPARDFVSGALSRRFEVRVARRRPPRLC